MLDAGTCYGEDKAGKKFGRSKKGVPMLNRMVRKASLRRWH